MVVSALTLLETQVALERKRKAGKLPSSVVAAVRAHIEAEVDRQRLHLHAVADIDYQGADGISQRVQEPIRSLDALHAAVAQRLGLELVTLDQRLHQAAQAVGIPTRWVDPATI